MFPDDARYWNDFGDEDLKRRMRSAAIALLLNAFVQCLGPVILLYNLWPGVAANLRAHCSSSTDTDSGVKNSRPHAAEFYRMPSLPTFTRCVWGFVGLKICGIILMAAVGWNWQACRGISMLLSLFGLLSFGLSFVLLGVAHKMQVAMAVFSVISVVGAYFVFPILGKVKPGLLINLLIIGNGMVVFSTLISRAGKEREKERERDKETETGRQRQSQK